MTFSIILCLAAFLCLLWVLRNDRVSLGLPVAYLTLLLLNHVPGAFAHVASAGFLYGSDLVEIGIYFTAIGSICFVAGAWLARFRNPALPIRHTVDRHQFWLFCLIGGWLFTFGLSFINRIPSVSAALENGGKIWMLGVLLGLRAAVQRGDIKRIWIWCGALLVYPLQVLLLGGFMSYGSAAVIVVCAVLAVSVRSYWRVLAGITLAVFLGLTVFVQYFAARDHIRDVVWGGADLEERVDAVAGAFGDFEWFDMSNERHLLALDRRLNQNYFVGLAAVRIEQGQVDYLYGRSLWEALLSLIPRALWPDKTVFGGSPAIVAEMTGLQLSTTTSFGVGQVMEFYINFGMLGLIFGFLLLGWLLGTLDRKAAAAEAGGDLGKVLLFFLPAVALIQPIGSMVELAGGSAAALVGAYGWKLALKHWAPQMLISSTQRPL